MTGCCLLQLRKILQAVTHNGECAAQACTHACICTQGQAELTRQNQEPGTTWFAPSSVADLAFSSSLSAAVSWRAASASDLSASCVPLLSSSCLRKDLISFASTCSHNDEVE